MGFGINQVNNQEKQNHSGLEEPGCDTREYSISSHGDGSWFISAVFNALSWLISLVFNALSWLVLGIRNGLWFLITNIALRVSLLCNSMVRPMTLVRGCVAWMWRCCILVQSLLCYRYQER
ncbi:unnamed protein product [Brassica oleracea var. botrytis]|uniref:Uncharacterized protein n=2 Tax=Brassica TaxID=3705 RepID=A0A3P6EKW3_BRAOL|nr:unnamed protein product [Brassica napus]VDD34365.1 unnamed protein product [Brassica oleracea]